MAAPTTVATIHGGDLHLRESIMGAGKETIAFIMHALQPADYNRIRFLEKLYPSF
jgi:hypothetical protein